jgi:hypothetical protein
MSCKFPKFRKSKKRLDKLKKFCYFRTRYDISQNLPVYKRTIASQKLLLYEMFYLNLITPEFS